MDERTSSRIRRPRRDSEQKSKAIMKAAAELFLRDGYSNTSMDAVALAAGVSKRTVYGHFGCKEDLFAEIIREMCLDVLPPGLGHAAEDPADSEERLVRIGTAFLSAIYSEKQIRLFRTIVSESRVYPEIGRMMYEGPVRASQIGLQVCLEQMVRAGTLDLEDTRFAAVLLMGMLKTDIHMRLLFNQDIGPGERNFEKIARQCIRLFINGARAR